MAGVGTPALAASVSEGRGLGSAAVGAVTPPKAREAIRETRELMPEPFAVNVFCHVPRARDGEAWIACLSLRLTTLFLSPPPSSPSLFARRLRPRLRRPPSSHIVFFLLFLMIRSISPSLDAAVFALWCSNARFAPFTLPHPVPGPLRASLEPLCLFA